MNAYNKAAYLQIAQGYAPTVLDPNMRLNNARPVDVEFHSFDAGYYLDATLKAKEPVAIFKRADVNSPVLRVVNAGEIVGEVLSYIQDKNGNIWWNLKGSDVGGSGGWVLHKVGRFDAETAKLTSSGITNELIDKSTSDAGSIFNFGNLTGSLKWVLIIAAILIVLYIVGIVRNVTR